MTTYNWLLSAGCVMSASKRPWSLLARTICSSSNRCRRSKRLTVPLPSKHCSRTRELPTASTSWGNSRSELTALPLTPWPLCSANCRNRVSAHFSAMRTASRCFTAVCSLNGTAPRRKCSKPGLTSFQTRASSSKRQKICACALRRSASCLIIKKSRLRSATATVNTVPCTPTTKPKAS